MIIRAAITRSNLKKSMQILLKNHLQFLAMSTSTTTDAMALKLFKPGACWPVAGARLVS